MAEFPGSSRVSTDYTEKTTTVYCLDCRDWEHTWPKLDITEAVIAKAFRAHHATCDRKARP